MYAYMCTYVYICVCICIHICMHIHLYIKILKLLFAISALPECVYVYHRYILHLLMSEEGIGYHGVTHSCELPCRS
jgi:surface polysaccharide O-acyltransferase-like enzyme